MSRTSRDQVGPPDELTGAEHPERVAQQVGHEVLEQGGEQPQLPGRVEQVGADLAAPVPDRALDHGAHLVGEQGPGGAADGVGQQQGRDPARLVVDEGGGHTATEGVAGDQGQVADADRVQEPGHPGGVAGEGALLGARARGCRRSRGARGRRPGSRPRPWPGSGRGRRWGAVPSRGGTAPAARSRSPRSGPGARRPAPCPSACRGRPPRRLPVRSRPLPGVRSIRHGAQCRARLPVDPDAPEPGPPVGAVRPGPPPGSSAPSRSPEARPSSYAHCDESTNRGCCKTMAQQQNKPVTGGNKPKPGNAAGGPGGQSAKDKSRAQSRPVTGKDVAKKTGGAGGAKGGNTPRPGGQARRPHPEEQPDLADPHGLERGRAGHRGDRGPGGGEGRGRRQHQQRQRHLHAR